MIYRNFLLISTSKQILNFSKHFSDCSEYKIVCRPKEAVPMSVAIIKANECVGKISAVLLKKCNLFKHMHLYDSKDCTDITCDLRTVSSGPIVKGFSGLQQYEKAVSNVRIVYICGGIQTVPGYSEQELFEKNAAWVKRAIIYTSEFNPDAHVVISTPPVSFLVPLAVEQFRKSGINAERRVYGVISHLIAQSNSTAGAHFKVIPSSVNSFIVGGCHRRNFIPVISHRHAGNNELVTENIQYAEDEVLRQKIREGDCSGCCLSYASAGYTFMCKLAQALKNKGNISACCFAKQQKPMDEYAKYFSCMVQLDKNGIKSCHIPKMSSFEKDLLKKVMKNIRLNIYLGSSYVTGDDMIVVRRPIVKKEEKKKEEKKEKKPPEAKKEVCRPCTPVRQITLPVKEEEEDNCTVKKKKKSCTK